MFQKSLVVFNDKFSFDSNESFSWMKRNQKCACISGSVKLVVRYTPRVLEEMEARFDKHKARRRLQNQ